MRARPVLLKIFRAPFGDQMNRQTGRVRGHDCSRLAHTFDPLEQFAFDIKILGDRFDNPIDLSAPGEIVFQISGRHEARCFRSEKRRRARFPGRFQPGQDDAIPYRGALDRKSFSLFVRSQLGGHNIEQEHGDASVRQVRRDARTHRPSSQNSNLLDSLFHRTHFMRSVSSEDER